MRKLVWVLVTIAAFGLFAFSMAKKRRQVVPQTCPFDTNLSVGIAFQGPHRYFDTGKVQEKIMNARIAWFRAIEQPNPDAFDERVYQEPPEEDWCWWTTLYPTTLIVQVTDAENRLGGAEVWNFDLNLLDGVIKATPDGSSITGTLTLEKPASFRQLIVKAKNGETLGKALFQNPETRLHIIVEVGGWIPHPPPRDVVTKILEEKLHAHRILVKEGNEEVEVDASCIIKRYQLEKGYPPCEGFNDQHFVESLSHGVSVIFGPPPQGCSMLDIRGEESCGTWVQMTRYPPSFDTYYCMTRGFINPEPKETSVDPPQAYGSKHVKRHIEIDLRSLAPMVSPEQTQLLKELEEEMKEEETTLTKAVKVPPYSEGGVHWHLRPVQPTVKGIWAVPYHKYKETSSWFEEFLVSAVKILIPGIIGRAHPIKIGLAEAAVEAWQRAVAPKKVVEKTEWLPQDAKLIGDFWVLRLSLVSQEEMNPPYHAKNLTQDVHVQIVVVRPDGTKVPTYGSLTIIRGQATTVPEPPKSPLSDQMSVENVPPEGVKIALGKGWKWKLTARAVGNEATKEISVPLEPPSVTIEVPAPQPPPGGEGD